MASLHWPWTRDEAKARKRDRRVRQYRRKSDREKKIIETRTKRVKRMTRPLNYETDKTSSKESEKREKVCCPRQHLLRAWHTSLPCPVECVMEAMVGMVLTKWAFS